MLEAKDPAIKLFGKTIPLADLPATAAVAGGDPLSTNSFDPPAADEDDNHSQDRPSSMDSSPENIDSNRVGEEREIEKDPLLGRLISTKQEDGDPPPTSEEIADPNVTSPMNFENPKVPSVENESAKSEAPKTEEEEEEGETSNAEEKTLKKPDKILPCPRCNSMDTKFCYYNNYNVNQPRHFCKNCQRYWTAGGTMRNVPVGAGRRKNKNLAAASHYRHITVSEALQNARDDLPNGILHQPMVKPNGTVLAFGSDTPLCESMASVLNIAEKTMQNCSINGFRKPEEIKIPVSSGDGENTDNHSSGCSVNDANSKGEVGKNGFLDPVMRNFPNFPPQVPCYPGAPWPYPWNPAQWSPQVPPPGLCPPGFPMPFYHGTPYWGCSVPSAWNVWVSPPNFSPNQTSPNSGPNSPTLGKHSRDENLPLQINSEEEKPHESSNNTEKCLWIPKTLRINDLGEAAKSSIWATLGIKNDKADSISKEGIFQAFQSKGGENDHISETSSLLQANPAALSRSLNFQERS